MLMFMTAKLQVSSVEAGEGYEIVSMHAVSKSEEYDATGSDENNTYAMFTPSADLTIDIRNPALLGQIKAGDTFYANFDRADDHGAVPEDVAPFD